MKISPCYLTVANLIAMLKMVHCSFNFPEQKASTSPSHEEGSCATRLDVLERKVDHQNKEMDNLRTKHKEFKTMFMTLKNNRETVTIDEHHLKNVDEATMKTKDLYKQNTDVEQRIILKKPARLLSMSLLLKPRNVSELPFNDPPANCRDLSHIGHTLNGFYPVQLNPVGEQKFGKIGITYCNFQPPSRKTTTSYVEKRVGLLDVKSSSIHFYVQRNKDFGQPNKVIPFEVELLNEGKAMNLKTGTFQAPVNGIYYFSFRGFHGASSSSLFSGNNQQVFLHLNDKTVATGVSSSLGGITFSLESTLKLKKGDKVYVKQGNTGLLKDNNIEHLTHFSGHLLEEDLTMLKN